MMTVGTKEWAKVFKALGDEKRLAIMELLRGGEKCACLLMEQLPLGQSALSYHMKILCESGLVTSRPEAKWVHYSLNEVEGQKAVELLKTLTTSRGEKSKGEY